MFVPLFHWVLVVRQKPITRPMHVNSWDSCESLRKKEWPFRIRPFFLWGDDYGTYPHHFAHRSRWGGNSTLLHPLQHRRGVQEGAGSHHVPKSALHGWREFCGTAEVFKSSYTAEAILSLQGILILIVKAVMGVMLWPGLGGMTLWTTTAK